MGCPRARLQRISTPDVFLHRRQLESHPAARGRVDGLRDPCDRAQRALSDDLWHRAQRRIQPAKEDKRFKAGGRPKFLLFGLLVCDACGSHYTITNQRSYECSSHHDGRACSNSVRVRRDRIETILLDPIRKELLTPERVEQMAKEMQAYYLDRVRVMQTRTVEYPQELQELSARIERLRERQKRGDPDMAADEIQAAAPWDSDFEAITCSYRRAGCCLVGPIPKG
jgi:hypothetical protein